MTQLTNDGKVALDNLVATLVQGGKIPGFAMGVANSEEELYYKGGGNKVYDSPASGEVDKDTAFWICSMTKLITHIAALQLLEKGKFNVDDPVSKYFPQFLNTIVIEDVTATPLVYTPAKNVVMVKHLLNFSSGLYYPPLAKVGMPPPYASAHNKENPHSGFFAHVQADLPGLPLKFEPGTDFAYGYSSDVLGFIVEQITGQTLEDYFQEKIFNPLGIKASFYLTPDVKDNLLHLAHRTTDGRLKNYSDSDFIETDPSKVFRHMGGVGLYTSLRDYLKLLRHILQIYEGKATNPILCIQSVRDLFIGTSTEAGVKSLDIMANSAPTKGNSWSTALAVSSVDAPGRRRKGSAFWSGWAGTYFFMDATTGIAAICGIQLITTPSGSRDPDFLNAYKAFEETVYANLTT